MRAPRMLRLGLVLALGLPALAPAQPVEPFVASTDVRLVTIQVHAFAAGEAAVTDLRRDEFQLFEDGNPIEIGHFEAIGSNRAAVAAESVPDGRPSATPSSRDDAPSLRLAVFLDNAHISPASRNRLLAELRAFLTGKVPPDARLSLVSLDPGLHVRVPFGESPNARRVLSALDSLELSTAQGMTADLDRQVALRNILEHQRQNYERPFPGEEPCDRHLGDFARAYAQSEHTRVQSSLAGLGAYVQSFASTPGRKAILHVSDGLPLVAGLPAYQLANRLCDGSGAMAGMQWAIDVGMKGPASELYDPRAATMEMHELDSTGLLDAVTAAANAHGVTFYTLQASSLGRTAFGSATAEGRGTDSVNLLAESGNLQDTLFALADETGGKALLDRVDFDRVLDEVAGELTRYYVLGFYPQRQGDDRAHRLEVKVTRPGVRLRHPRSYRDTAPDTRVAEDVLGALIQQVERADFPLTLDSRPAAGGRQTTLRIHLPLDRLTLVEQQGGEHLGSFTAFVAVLRPDGSLLRVRQKTVPVALPTKTAAQYLYEVRLDLAPGTHAIAVAIRDDLGGELSIQRTTLQVAGRR